MHRSERVRFLAMAQAAIDRGDPEVFAQHVTSDRIDEFDTGKPQVLIQMAVADTIVPNTSTAHLARALGIPIVGSSHVAMRDVEVDPDLPLRGNLAAGHTGALFQFAHVARPGSPHELEPATHATVLNDPFAREQRMTFLATSEEPRRRGHHRSPRRAVMRT